MAQQAHIQECTIELMSELTGTDIYHFREGTFFRAYDKLGAHPQTLDGIEGTRFAVWAPNAASRACHRRFQCLEP